MKIAARLILILFSLLLIGVGLLLAAVGLDRFPGTSLDMMAGDLTYTFIGTGLVVLVLIILVLSLRSPVKREPGGVTLENELGEVSISLAAMENMVLREVKKNKGIKDVDRRVVYKPEKGLVVYLRIKIFPDLVIPDLSTELQEKIKSHLEQITGFAVSQVKILVENVVLDQAVLKKPN